MAFTGCGAQAPGHWDGFSGIYLLKEVFICGRGADNQRLLRDQAEARHLRVIEADNASKAIQQADITITTISDNRGRSNSEQSSAFVFRRMAIGNLSLASLAHQRACIAGLGQGLPR